MILQPKPLVGIIVAPVSSVTYIEFDQKLAILKTRWVKRYAVLEDNTDESPFAVSRRGRMSDEKESIVATNDGSDEVRDRWDRWGGGRRLWWWTMVHDGFR